MWTTSLDLNDFYRSTLGQMTTRLLRARLREVWPTVHGETVLGFGYATPFLRPFAEEAARTIAFMPAAAGRHPLAARGPQPHRPGRRDGPAARRQVGRPRRAGPCRRMHRTGATDAARDLAGDGRWRPPAGRHADTRAGLGRRSIDRRSTRASLLAGQLAGLLRRQHVRADAADARAFMPPPVRGWRCAWRRPSNDSAGAGSAASPASASSRPASSSMPASPNATNRNGPSSAEAAHRQLARHPGSPQPGRRRSPAS